MMMGWWLDDGAVNDGGKATSSPDRKLAIVTTPASTDATLARTAKAFWRLRFIGVARICKITKKA